MTDDIRITTRDGIRELRFSRPDKKNAVTSAMYVALRDGVIEAEADDAVRVILFTADGEAFTAGNDLADFLADRVLGLDEPVYGFLRALATAGKPVVAAVHGIAIGIGTTMLLHCDIVLASPTTRLIAPFVNLGIVPEAASTLLLPRAIGHQRAAAFVMLGEPIDAGTALDLGLVNRIVAADELAEAAWTTARALAAKAPDALRLTKALLKDDRDEIVARIDREGLHLEAQLASPESAEAILAMREKRPPVFGASS